MSGKVWHYGAAVVFLLILIEAGATLPLFGMLALLGAIWALYEGVRDK